MSARASGSRRSFMATLARLVEPSDSDARRSISDSVSVGRTSSTSALESV